MVLDLLGLSPQQEILSALLLQAMRKVEVLCARSGSSDAFPSQSSRAS